MPSLRELMRAMLADDRLDGHELEALCDLMYADEVIDRHEAEFLIDLYQRVERVSPGFETFVHGAVCRHLAGGEINPEEAVWLRRVVSVDGRVTERGKRLVRAVGSEESRGGPEFDALYAECTS